VQIEALTLSLKECAALAGIDRHRWSKWVKSGLAPRPLNPGERYWLWSKAEVVAWLEGGGR